LVYQGISINNTQQSVPAMPQHSIRTEWDQEQGIIVIEIMYNINGLDLKQMSS